MISVSGWRLGEVRAPTRIARSNAMVSPICWHGFSTWSCLSIDAPSTCRKKPRLFWCAVPAVAVVEQIDRLRRHVGERRLVGRPLVLRRSVWPAGRPLPGNGAACSPLHSSDMLPALNRPRTRSASVAGEARGVEDHLVALQLRRLDDGLADVRPAGDHLLEAREAAAEQHVDVVIDRLLGDRSGSAVFLLRRARSWPCPPDPGSRGR